MSAGPESSAKQSNEGHGSSESSGGFRSFWTKSTGSAAPQSFKFVEQQPTTKSGSARGSIARFFRQGSATPSNEEPGQDASPESGKRRQQVYNAQKLHRERKANYVRTLEAEVSRLQALDSAVNTEKTALAHQNQTIKNLLASHSIDAQLSATGIGSSTPIADISSFGSAAIDIRLDPEMQHERIFADLLGSYSSHTNPQADPKVAVEDDSWAALDFILALEWPCRDHVAHPSINPGAKIPEACEVGHFHGHALTATSAVYASAQPPDTGAHRGLAPETREKWQLPHSEIDKLVKMSENLPIKREEITPAQAYAVVKQNLPSVDLLRPVLEALKEPLGLVVTCYGFGATMPTETFERHFDTVCQTLSFTKRM